MLNFPCRRLIAHILLFSQLLSSCGSPNHWRMREEAPSASLQAVEPVPEPVPRPLKMEDKRQQVRRQGAENPSILHLALSLCTIRYPISHPLIPSATTLHFKHDTQGCFVVIGDQQLPVIFENGFTAAHLVGSNATWQEQHIHPYPSLADNKNSALATIGFLYIGHPIHTDHTTFTSKENYTIEITATRAGLAAKVSFPALGDGFFICPLRFAPGHSLSTLSRLPTAAQRRAIALVKVSRPLSPCAYVEEFIGATTRRTGAYSNVREDSSIGATHKLPAEVALREGSSEDPEERIIYVGLGLQGGSFLNCLGLGGCHKSWCFKKPIWSCASCGYICPDKYCAKHCDHSSAHRCQGCSRCPKAYQCTHCYAAYRCAACCGCAERIAEQRAAQARALAREREQREREQQIERQRAALQAQWAHERKQEQLRQEAAIKRQNELRAEQLRQEAYAARQREEAAAYARRQNELRAEQLRQEQIRQEQLRQEQLRQEQIRQAAHTALLAKIDQSLSTAVLSTDDVVGYISDNESVTDLVAEDQAETSEHGIEAGDIAPPALSASNSEPLASAIDSDLPSLIDSDVLPKLETSLPIPFRSNLPIGNLDLLLGNSTATAATAPDAMPIPAISNPPIENGIPSVTTAADAPTEATYTLPAAVVRSIFMASLSEANQHKLNQAPPALQSSVIDYFTSGVPFYPAILDQYPVCRWIRESLLQEMVTYPGETEDVMALNNFRKAWQSLGDYYSIFQTTPLLHALKAKKMAHGLSLLELADLLTLVAETDQTGYDLLCGNRTDWFPLLKRHWLSTAIAKLSPAFAGEAAKQLTTLLVDINWNSLGTKLFLKAIANEFDFFSIAAFLALVKKYKVADSLVIPIVSSAASLPNSLDTSSASAANSLDTVPSPNQAPNQAKEWLHTLSHQLCYHAIYQLSPTLAQALDEPVFNLLKSSCSVEFLIKSITDLSASLVNSPTAEAALAEVLSLLYNYQLDEAGCAAALAHLANLDPISKELNSEAVDQFLVAQIFKAAHTYSPTELIHQIVEKSPGMDSALRRSLQQRYEAIGAAYQSPSALVSNETEASITPPSVVNSLENTPLESLNKLKALKSKPIAQWDKAAVTFWASQALKTETHRSIDSFERIAVVQRAVELTHGISPRATQLLALLLLLPSCGEHSCGGQLSEGISALRRSGRLAQINTGEGKSLIVAMLAAIHGLQGKKVDVVTTSTQLSIPEVKKQSPFFELLGLTVAENSRLHGKQEAYKQPIVYGTASDFQGDILRSEFLGQPLRGDRGFGVVIVDEVDSMLFDNRSHSVRLSAENPGMNHLELPLGVVWETIHKIVRHMVEEEGKVYFMPKSVKLQGDSLADDPSWRNYAIPVADKKSFITERTQAYLNQLLRVLAPEEAATYKDYQALQHQLAAAHNALEIATAKESQVAQEKVCKKSAEKKAHIIKTKEAQIALSTQLEAQLKNHPWHQYPSILDLPAHLYNFSRGQIPYWIKNALAASYGYKKEAHYDVRDGRIVPINYNETGVLQSNMVWSDGLTQFLQIKEGLAIDPEGISTNFISNVSYFQRYGNSIYGLTGTLDGGRSPIITQDGSNSHGQSPFFETLYHTDSVIIPPYKQAIIANNEHSPYLCKELRPLILPDRSSHHQAIVAQVLTHAQQHRGVLVICKYIQEVKRLYNLLSQQYDAQKITTYTGQEAFTKDHIDSGEIIIATNIAGRGTDITTFDGVEAHGGMYVAITFLPESNRVELQNAGRTARAGKRGMAQLILHDPTGSDIQTLKAARSDKEAKAITKSIADAQRMLEQDALFSQFCTLANRYLPLASDCDKEKQWHQLTEKWADYSTEKWATLAEKSAQWMETTQQSLIDQAFATLSASEKATLTLADQQAITQKAEAKVLAGRAEFEERYKATILAHFCESQQAAVAEELLLALQEGKTFELDRSELAKKYNWGIHERKGFEEDWGFWLKAQHLEEANGSTEASLLNPNDRPLSPCAYAEEFTEATERRTGAYSNVREDSSTGATHKLPAEVALRKRYDDFANLAHHNAPQDLLVKNPYFYLLKGNESLRRGYCSDALVSYERAIAMDPLFSVNAHYCKAHALLLYKENKGARQQQAYAALQQAKTLINNIYEPALMSFHALVSQEGTQVQTSKHIQQQLNLLNQQKTYIQDACKVIEKAQEKDHDVKLTTKELAEVFEKSEEKYYKAIHEAAVNGLTQFFTITEVVPTPWWSIIGLTLLAAAQLTAGFLIAACTGNTALISEGVSDLITAVKSAATGTFNWATWATQKAISLVVSLVSMGWNSVKEGCQGIKNTAKDLIGSSAVGATDKGVKFAAREIGTQLGKGAFKECLNLSGQCLANKLFMENWEQKIIKQVGDALTQAMLANPLVVAALAQDVTNGDNHWQQIFLQEGMALLAKQEDHVCLQMAKSIALGVAKNKIPCAKALFEVKGVVEMMDKLSNYTDEFIKKFNKKVAEHKQEIEQAEQTNQATSSSQVTSSQVTTLLTPPLAVEVEDDDIAIQGADCYSSATVTPAAKLRVTAITASTPESLAGQLKSSIASELSGSIRANLIEPAIGYGQNALSTRLFAQIDENNKKRLDEVKTARDHRSNNNATANRGAAPKGKKKATDKPEEPLSKSAEKTIKALKYKDLQQDETVLAALSGATGIPITIADAETGKLKNVIGDELKGKPIQLSHTKPSAENPHGHFDPTDSNFKVTPTGKNSCWLDAAWSQLPPDKKAELKDVNGLKDKMVQFMRDNPAAINKACQTRDRLEKIAPEDIRKGGMTPLTGLMLVEKGAEFGGIVGGIGGACFGPGGAVAGHRIGRALGPAAALGLGLGIERLTGQELETTFGQLKSGIFGQRGRDFIKPGHTYPEGFTGIPKVLRNMPGGMSAAERELLIPFGGVTPLRPEDKMPFSLNMDKTSKEGKAEARTSRPNLNPSQRKAIDGIKTQIEKHKQKLQDYINNPDACDNKGFLKSAAPKVREKIINTRIEKLKKQIQTFEKDIQAINNGTKSVLKKLPKQE